MALYVAHKCSKKDAFNEDFDMGLHRIPSFSRPRNGEHVNRQTENATCSF